MMVTVEGVLSPAEAAALRERLVGADWVDGNATSGAQAALAKRNRQLPQDGSAAVEGGRLILERLERHPVFTAAALPKRVLPPLFNRYGEGDGFDDHVDNAVRGVPASAGGGLIRTDLSATLFLTEPEAYDGGELVVSDTYGEHEVKLGSGDLILYPASSLHRVLAITRGERVSAFFWVQSLVRDDASRALLLQMDVAIQQLAAELGQDRPELVALTGTYHNLLRMWAEV